MGSREWGQNYFLVRFSLLLRLLIVGRRDFLWPAAPTYGASAKLQYKGTITQTTGPELPATIPNLTIDNANGVILSISTTISGTLTQTSGNIDIAVGAYTLTVNGGHNAGTNTVSGAGGYTLASGALYRYYWLVLPF